MSDQANIDRVKRHFSRSQQRLTDLAAEFVDDEDAAVAEASELFDRMIPEMAYVDTPKAPMAWNLFVCNASLALFLVLRRRGVCVHDYGRAMLEQFRRMPMPDDTGSGPVDEWIGPLRAAGEESQRSAQRGEFVFEVIDSRPGLDWGMNITSCAICYQFAKYDAMDLVPYMCATDDVMSDRAGEGLQRTGTIALGAHQCDFRYRSDGPPLRVAEAYPDRIKVERDR